LENNGNKLRILVVDDMRTIRNVIVNGIKKTFFNVEIDDAHDGHSAQTKLQKLKFDMIISDWEMPKMSGIELLQWVRKEPALNKIPFIMLTANSSKESIIETMRLGVDAYMIKPFTIEGLVAKMSEIINKLDRREYERFVANSPVTIHCKEAAPISGNLVDISAGGLFGTFPMVTGLPYILDDVVADIFYETPEGHTATASLKGFVIRLQAAEAFRNSEHIKIAIKFDEACAEGNSELAKFFNQLNNMTPA